MTKIEINAALADVADNEEVVVVVPDNHGRLNRSSIEAVIKTEVDGMATKPLLLARRKVTADGE